MTAVLKLLCQISWRYVYRVCGAIEIPEKSGPSRLTRRNKLSQYWKRVTDIQCGGEVRKAEKDFAREFFASVVMPSISPDLMDKDVGRHKTNVRTTY